MDLSTESNKLSSLTELSKLSREELISQLLKAQKKIQELVLKQTLRNNGPPINSTITGEAVSCCSKDGDSQVDSLFKYFPSDSSMQSELENYSYTDQKQLVDRIQLKLNAFDDCHKPFMNNDDEFIVVYECNGDFPSCDEDLSKSSLADDQNVVDTHHREVTFADVTSLNSDEYDNDENQPENFPLIPSPVLDTPPYEYIFLTKGNEAKYRIFLNQKLNKVFQDELKKLQHQEEQLLHDQGKVLSVDEDDHQGADLHVQTLFGEPGSKRHEDLGLAYCMDVHNKNHLMSNTYSVQDVNASLSKPNVIHCFDPSDVDLELKKIFTEKPPVTHKIVRRRSRKERGSSVPAVDSYYGTRDLNKVGHASYFIPTLTDSERKAIGWKHEYHYGHWKYATLSVPNPKKNQIFLHPHVELTEISDTKHHNNNHRPHSDSLQQNPLHHKEIDLSEPYVAEDDTYEANEGQQKNQSKHHHIHIQPCNEECIDTKKEDTLSFITLSGCSNDMSQSCHIIPDKCTLRRILKWLLPCVNKSTKSNTSGISNTAPITQKDNRQDAGDKCANTKKNGREDSKKHHEIETLVEPSGKLNFPVSHTYISFVASPCEENRHVLAHVLSNSEDGTQQHERESEEQEASELEHHHQYHHEHHHHNHGMFNWKKFSHHGASSSIESTNVMGGDVIESVHDCVGTEKDYQGDDVNIELIKDFKESVTEQDMHWNNGRQIHAPFTQLSSTDSESEKDEVVFDRPRTTRKGKKLQPCKAYTKLLTLKDLGYETDEKEAANAEDVVARKLNQEEVKSQLKTSSSDIGGFTSLQDCEVKTQEACRSNNNGQSFSGGQRNQKIHDGGYIRLNLPTNENRVNTRNLSSMGMPTENDDTSSADSAGYPFSSMSISHQNSVISSLDTDIASPSISITKQDGTETRFLDPKDILLEHVERNSKSHPPSTEEENLPFTYDLDNLQYDGDTELIDTQLDENVIEWMGDDFVDDAEEGEELGLLNSYFTTVMEHTELHSNSKLVAFVREQEYLHQDHDERGPEKVRAQHYITTLNALEYERATQSKNN